jgi:Type II CAAX prenyl endopeptidase Rce1-like
MSDARLRRRRVLALTAAGVLGVFAVLPHPLEHVAQFLATGVLIAIAAAAGAWFAPRTGLATPVIDAALTRRPFIARARSIAVLATLVGVVTAVAIVALDVVVFAPLVPETKALPARPLWTGALAALYGALAEETLWRYGAMSVLSWLFAHVVRGRSAYWSAILGASVVFGLAHLPATEGFLPLTPLLAIRTTVLVGGAGVAFGWLYWRRGLEAAMVGHGVASVIVHAAVPAIGV